MFKLNLEKAEGTRDQIANICWIIEKAREFQKNIRFIDAWRIPWTEEPGRLQSVGSQRVRHDSSDLPPTHRGWERIQLVGR